MKHLILSLLLAANALLAQAQAVGTWHQHRAYGNVTDQIVADGLVFCIASGNLFSYDTETGEVNTFDTGNGPNGNGISFMEFDSATHTLVIVYADGLIDLIDTRTLDISGLAALRDSGIAGKTVNSTLAANGTAWLCTDFGFVTVDLANRQFGDTYDVGQKVATAAMHESTLYYCVKGGGLYKASTDSNLHDQGAHVRINSLNFTRLLVLGDYLYGQGWKVFYRMDITKNLSAKNLDSEMMSYMRVSGDKLMACYPQKVIEVDMDGQPETFTTGGTAVSSISRHGDKYWVSCCLEGLQRWARDEEGQLAYDGISITPNSPRYDYFYRMHYAGDRLLVAGGAHEYTGVNYEGMASYYENGTWTNLDTVVIQNEKYQNITDITQHPDDPTLHYVSSMGHGVYVYRNGHLQDRYSTDNTPLMTILPTSSHYYDYIRTSAPTFDSKGNMWVLNCEVDTVIWRMSADGKTWKGFYFEEIAKARSPIMQFFDSKGRLWMLSRDIDSRGVFCYNPSTKKHRLSTLIVQQDGLYYDAQNFLSMALDKDEYIWVGTEMGLFVIDEPDKFFDEDFEFTQIKVNRDDGSGLADYLLSGAAISAIAVDGGNRKWIGTLGSGVYLLSPDGQETMHHFTTDNAPLPSNDIRSIAVNPSTGEVMIGTMNGLVSYMGDATEPEESLDENNVTIYPNPVRPEYEGDVIIRGLTSDCEVKIATVGGQVIWRGTSVGGTLTWNCQRQGGGRVASGVYNVIINTADANNVIVGRLAVIR